MSDYDKNMIISKCQHAIKPTKTQQFKLYDVNDSDTE